MHNGIYCPRNAEVLGIGAAILMSFALVSCHWTKPTCNTTPGDPGQSSGQCENSKPVICIPPYEWSSKAQGCVIPKSNTPPQPGPGIPPYCQPLHPAVGNDMANALDAHARARDARFRPKGPAFGADCRTGQRVEQTFTPSFGDCYTVFAMGPAGMVGNVDVEMFPSNVGPGSMSVSDASASNIAAAPPQGCIPLVGGVTMTVRVTPRLGGGPVVARLYGR